MSKLTAIAILAFFSSSILTSCAGSSSGTPLKACAEGYKESVDQVRSASAYYNELKRSNASGSEQEAAGREVVNQCVRHFEEFGTANCTVNGQPVFRNQDPNAVYQQCKSAQGH